MRRYEIWKNADGTVTVEEHPRGDWMRSTEADAVINRMEAGLLSMIQSELPEAEPDPIDPGGFVQITVSHMDHEAYREAIRKAMAALKAAVK